jgi:hypothetical protein
MAELGQQFKVEPCGGRFFQECSKVLKGWGYHRNFPVFLEILIGLYLALAEIFETVLL